MQSHLERTLRDAVALDPLMTVTQLQTVLQNKFNRDFSWRYVTKLRDKLYRRMLKNAVRSRLISDFALIAERHRVYHETLRRTAFDPTTDKQEQVDIIMRLAQMELALFKTGVECGIYDQSKLSEAESSVAEVEDSWRYNPPPQEEIERFVNSFKIWHTSPPPQLPPETAKQALLEEKVDDTPKDTTNGPKPQPKPKSPQPGDTAPLIPGRKQ